jgi:hypothetical protein
MTAPASDVPDGAPATSPSSADEPVPGLPLPPVHPDPYERVSPWAWVGLIVLLMVAVAATATLLLLQWMAPGSGTVAG